MMRDVTILDLLEWAYRHQLVLEASDRGLTQAERWERGLTRLRSPLAAGPRVDGGSGWGSGRCHADAETVHAVVSALTKSEQRAALIRHARVGSRPAWFPGAEARRIAVLRANGNPVRLYDGNRNCIGLKTRLAVFIGDRDTGLCPEGLRLAREAWTLWAEGVQKLAGYSWQLCAHRVVGNGVAVRPWEEDC
jgi:hypothetical protein